MKIDFPEYVLRILGSYESAGYKAYAVGGCVRDSLLGRTPHDWDIASSARPDETMRIMTTPDFSVKALSGLKHGTVTVVVKNGGESVASCEVTTFRRDGKYTDSRRPDGVIFTGSLDDDLARRDFTVNAMAARPGELCDPYRGEDDLRDKLIRAVGDPDERFSEDALRIMRALRFSAVLGFTIERETASAMHRCAGLMKNVSVERISSELYAILASDFPEKVIPEFSDVIAAALPETSESPDLSAMLPALCPDVRFALIFGTSSADAARLLKMPSKFVNRVSRIAAASSIPESGAEKCRLIRECRGFYGECLEYAGIITGERQRAIRVTRELYGIEASGKCVSLSDLAVNGNDLTALGTEGKVVGKTLSFLLDSVCSGTLPNDREILLAEAQNFISNGVSDVFK